MIDVGCDSGRLAVALRPYLTGKFLGTDVLQPALDYAREKVARPNWKFVRTIEPFRYVDGREASGTVEFGQSIAIGRA